MNKTIALLMCILLTLSLAACGNTASSAGNSSLSTASPADSTPTTSSESGESTDEPVTNGDSKMLVVYFSHSGNTEKIANMITEQTGADLFEVETVTVYPEDIAECTDLAKEEQDNDARPELTTHVDDMGQYDIIFLGYPNWWGTMPMAMFTFLEEYDFSDKTIIPFCTHLGSALGRSETDIAKLAPDATLLDGLAIRGSSVDSAQSDVTAWLNTLSITE